MQNITQLIAQLGADAQFDKSDKTQLTELAQQYKLTLEQLTEILDLDLEQLEQQHNIAQVVCHIVQDPDDVPDQDDEEQTDDEPQQIRQFG